MEREVEAGVTWEGVGRGWGRHGDGYAHAATAAVLPAAAATAAGVAAAAAPTAGGGGGGGWQKKSGHLHSGTLAHSDLWEKLPLLRNSS